MNAIFQVVRSADGQRSPPATAERSDFALTLRDLLERDESPIADGDYVLVIAERKGDDWDLSLAPLFRVDSFISSFAPQSESVA